MTDGIWMKEILLEYISARAGTIRSSAVLIRIRYGPFRYDAYSIRYTCTRYKVSKSRMFDFKKKVNDLD